MLNIFYVSIGILWIVIPLLCLVFVWRNSFPGKPWLMAFISITLLASVIAFLLPMLLGASESAIKTMQFYFTNVAPIIYTSSFAFLLLFTLNLQSSNAGIKNKSTPNSNNPYTSNTSNASKPNNTSLLPPLWLLILTGIASVMCLIHNANGSILRSIVLSIIKPRSGYGAAGDYANHLNAMGTVANVVGTLYIITVLLWLTCIVIVIFKFFKNRNRTSA